MKMKEQKFEFTNKLYRELKKLLFKYLRIINHEIFIQIKEKPLH